MNKDKIKMVEFFNTSSNEELVKFFDKVDSKIIGTYFEDDYNEIAKGADMEFKRITSNNKENEKKNNEPLTKTYIKKKLKC